MSSVLETLPASFDRAIEEFNLIQPGDRIMVGLSGGKDSLTMVDQLSRVVKAKNRSFKVIAAHIKFSNLPYSVDTDYLEKFCADREIEYHLVTDQIRDGHMGNGTCIHCSRYRRAKLMELTRVFNCNKLALGHHLDDIVATLLMNMTAHGRFSGMAVKLDITVGEAKHPLTIIRPLALVPEDDIIVFNRTNEFHNEKCRCPWGDTGYRSKARDTTDILCGITPEARMNLFRAQLNRVPREPYQIPASIYETGDIEEVAC